MIGILVPVWHNLFHARRKEVRPEQGCVHEVSQGSPHSPSNPRLIRGQREGREHGRVAASEFALYQGPGVTCDAPPPPHTQNVFESPLDKPL